MFRRAGERYAEAMRLLAIGIALGIIVFIATAGHIVFLPLLFLPVGIFSFGHRRRARDAGPLARRRGRF